MKKLLSSLWALLLIVALSLVPVANAYNTHDSANKHRAVIEATDCGLIGFVKYGNAPKVFSIERTGVPCYVTRGATPHGDTAYLIDLERSDPTYFTEGEVYTQRMGMVADERRALMLYECIMFEPEPRRVWIHSGYVFDKQRGAWLREDDSEPIYAIDFTRLKVLSDPLPAAWGLIPDRHDE